MRKLLQQLLILTSAAFIITSCEKGEEPFPFTVNNEKTLVHFPAAEAGPLATVALTVNPGVVTINLLEIRREASTPAELNKTLVIKVKHQNALIADPSAGAIRELPRNLYANHPDNPFDGQYWTVTFKPGEFVKHLKIDLDPTTLLTVGSRVGIGFQIAETPGALISEAKGQIGVEISAKNQYDGVYRLTWTNYHPSLNPGYTGSTTDVEMRTTGPNKVKLFWPLASAYCIPSILNGNLSYFLQQEPEYTVNQSTNAITIQNVGGAIVYELAQGFNTRYDPATKTIYAKYGYNYSAGAFNPATTREWTQTMVYLRPR